MEKLRLSQRLQAYRNLKKLVKEAWAWKESQQLNDAKTNYENDTKKDTYTETG